jgi:hypothetical protein
VGNGLPLGQAAVLQIRVDFALTLVLKRGEDAFEVRIEQPFEFVAADGGVHALDPVRLGPVLACARTAVAGATVFEDGRLEVGFADGSVIRVPVSEEYEGWNLVGPDGLRVVAGPGSKVTNWSGVG